MCEEVEEEEEVEEGEEGAGFGRLWNEIGRIIARIPRGVERCVSCITTSATRQTGWPLGTRPHFDKKPFPCMRGGAGLNLN